MTTQPLNAALTREVLAYLGVEAPTPDLSTLDALMRAYVRRVPWESAFRIARRVRTPVTADCPRWPVAFWRAALDQGGGGTCFESNYAFFSLLLALGYTGYLTVNDMGDTRACHTAIVVTLGDERWLVDVGLPLHLPAPLDRQAVTQRVGPFHTYTVRPEGSDRYTVERDRHPAPYCFTFVDVPVADAAYRAATTADYGPGGLFLDQVIVNKIIDGEIWRYNSAEPGQFDVFSSGEKRVVRFAGDEAAGIAGQFGMDEQTVREALSAVGS